MVFLTEIVMKTFTILVKLTNYSNITILSIFY